MNPMSTLEEIEAAADALPAEEKQELMLFLASRLRSSGAPMPDPRKFTREEMARWIAEDEADMPSASIAKGARTLGRSARQFGSRPEHTNPVSE